MERVNMRKIGVIGLGYVGLPLALAFAKKFPYVIGFDINKKKIEQLKAGHDNTGEASKLELINTTLKMTSDENELHEVDFFIVAVPTPVAKAHIPDLSYVIKATETVGRVIKKGSIVVYESTVYPGVTEEVCGSILEKMSGLKQGVDFNLGYSPERINPGDKVHSLEKVIKVVAGDTQESLQIIAEVYGTVVKAGIHKATSIKVAEAAKVIENTQRDLNIALMNELAIIFDRLEINTRDVLEAARTKWNFIDFRPGLVGGHCIGVDPYYLTYKAEEVGYHPQVILAGRRINDSMGKFIAEKTVKLLSNNGIEISKAKVGILGLTFKENVPDLRNSRVPDIISELAEYGIKPLIHDPLGNPEEAKDEYGLELDSLEKFYDLDALILAVAHKYYQDLGINKIEKMFKTDSLGVFIDVKSLFKQNDFSNNVKHWSL